MTGSCHLVMRGPTWPQSWRLGWRDWVQADAPTTALTRKSQVAGVLPPKGSPTHVRMQRRQGRTGRMCGWDGNGRTEEGDHGLTEGASVRLCDCEDQTTRLTWGSRIHAQPWLDNVLFVSVYRIHSEI